MRLLGSLLALLALTSCDSASEKATIDIDLRGSWYTNGGERGINHSLVNYVEIYVMDSTLSYQDEDIGTTWDQRYYIKGDTLFKCFEADSGCEFIPMYRLRKYQHDTLWLTINAKFARSDSNSYWVRFPKDETGPYELTWTTENSDSLRYKILVDYYRRKHKWHLTRENQMERYDSLVNAGRWKWSMKEFRESEERFRKERE